MRQLTSIPFTGMPIVVVISVERSTVLLRSDATLGPMLRIVTPIVETFYTKLGWVG